ncbi:glycosyl transferase family 2 [Aphanothece hegewaldii CCALA 016]|uniref:Glycosyl transferase family 2 n=1 Tax=Aphanothece hegewaldii CCALA 016 TaxID=2107694 RepID=A0A2T1LW96_9CHRO|nr:Gfo/Idh/MocA family oxidoreductase [Aphanothece hegewaldii]PSF36170.1 glycosyl transferase family 2 [Aphanothece hegewaldii CCALA 016]
MNSPLKVGIVGTGYAAQRRAEAIQEDERSQLLYFAGNRPESIKTFSQTYSIPVLNSWQELATHPELDLVIIANINRDHAQIAKTALQAGKHVIVEYPLAFTAYEGQELINIAKQQNKLLHVEHIELLGGLHNTIRQYLSEIGEVFFARYNTTAIQHIASRRWTYHKELFGFPFIAALSRIHRLTNLFGEVASVSCQSRFWDAPEEGYFTSCLSDAQIKFTSGIIAQATYGKGEVFRYSDRTFELHGTQGSLIFWGEEGKLMRDQEEIPLLSGTRRGLFKKDTQLVLDYLFEQQPLYVNVEDSLYALKVAQAAEQSSITIKTVLL